MCRSACPWQLSSAIQRIEPFSPVVKNALTGPHALTLAELTSVWSLCESGPCFSCATALPRPLRSSARGSWTFAPSPFFTPIVRPAMRTKAPALW